jgi:hypothetical protein
VASLFGEGPEVVVHAAAECRFDHWLAAHDCFGEVLEGSRQRRTRKANRELAHRRVAVALTEQQAQGGESELISPDLLQQAATDRRAERARVCAGSLRKLGARARTARDTRRKVEARHTGDDVRQLISAHQLREAGGVSIFKISVERICHGTSLAQSRGDRAPLSAETPYVRLVQTPECQPHRAQVKIRR